MTYCVYIMANGNGQVLYIGVTNDLVRRAYEHRNHLVDGFTSRYNVTKLVWYQTTESIEAAIIREKQLKAGSRQKKLALIEAMNPNYEDLYIQLTEIAAVVPPSQ